MNNASWSSRVGPWNNSRYQDSSWDNSRPLRSFVWAMSVSIFSWYSRRVKIVRIMKNKCSKDICYMNFIIALQVWSQYRFWILSASLCYEWFSGISSTSLYTNSYLMVRWWVAQGHEFLLKNTLQLREMWTDVVSSNVYMPWIISAVTLFICCNRSSESDSPPASHLRCSMVLYAFSIQDWNGGLQKLVILWSEFRGLHRIKQG